MRQIIARKDFIILAFPTPKKDTGIVLPQKKNPEGMPVTSLKVAYVGPDVKEVRVDDCIVIDSANAAVPFEHEDQLYFLTKEDCVGAILRKESLDIPEKV